MSRQIQEDSARVIINELASKADGLKSFLMHGGIVQSCDKSTFSRAPILTCQGNPDSVTRLIDCFAAWEGPLKITVLQGDGLCDMWVD